MTRFFSALTASAVVLAACANVPEVTNDTAGEATLLQPLQGEPTDFELAMATVDNLVGAGNTPTAIDRLTQLLGNPDLTDVERADALFKRAALRYSTEGYNIWGAIDDLSQINANYPDYERLSEVRAMLDLANSEATSLATLLEVGELGRQDRFDAVFRLGQHEDAIDMMLSSNLKPTNDQLVAMLQIGFLCESEDLTGQSYDLVEPDGTARSVQFCDFGK